MPIQPLYDRVLVRPAELSKRSAGGLHLPENALLDKKAVRRGEVLATGQGRLNQAGHVCALAVRPGDVVLYGPFSGDEIEDGDERFVMLREQDILGILAPE